MSASTFSFAISLIVGFAVGVLTIAHFPAVWVQDKWERAVRIEAVQHGAAEWRVVDETGKVEFHWLTEKKK